MEDQTLQSQVIEKIEQGIAYVPHEWLSEEMWQEAFDKEDIPTFHAKTKPVWRFPVPLILYREALKSGRPLPEAMKSAPEQIREQYPGKTTQELIELSRELYRQGKL